MFFFASLPPRGSTLLCATLFSVALVTASASTDERGSCRSNVRDLDCVSDDIPDAALSLMQRHAARFTSKNVAAEAAAIGAAAAPVVEQEYGVVNLIRHAEKCAGSGYGLSKFGGERAAYLARCMSTDTPSPVMPFGNTSNVRVIAGEGHTSLRVGLTVWPLAEKLGADMHNCEKLDVKCFYHHVFRELHSKGTVVVAWAHLAIPLLVESFRATQHWSAHMPGLYKKWPHECQSRPEPPEPGCVSHNGDSPCYDAIWQIKFVRPKGGNETSWQATNITTLSQGFGGNSSSPCALGLDPASRAPSYQESLELPKGWLE